MGLTCRKRGVMSPSLETHFAGLSAWETPECIFLSIDKNYQKGKLDFVLAFPIYGGAKREYLLKIKSVIVFFDHKKG